MSQATQRCALASTINAWKHISFLNHHFQFLGTSISLNFVAMPDVIQTENQDTYASTYSVMKANIEANLDFQYVHLFLILFDL